LTVGRGRTHFPEEIAVFGLERVSPCGHFTDSRPAAIIGLDRERFLQASFILRNISFCLVDFPLKNSNLSPRLLDAGQCGASFWRLFVRYTLLERFKTLLSISKGFLVSSQCGVGTLDRRGNLITSRYLAWQANW
jgi:hypothetical protein